MRSKWPVKIEDNTAMRRLNMLQTLSCPMSHICPQTVALLALLASHIIFVTMLSAQSTGMVSRAFLPHPVDPTKRIEYLVVKPSGSGPWPMMVYVHGHQEGARPGAEVYATQGVLQQMAQRGILSIAVSQPGYGQSDGPPDFCGPYTQQAVMAVMDHMRKRPEVLPKRVGLYGYSRGAMVAAMIGTKDANLRILVLGAGIYDMRDAYERFDRRSPLLEGLARSMEEEAGVSAAAFEARSALKAKEPIHAATLILHGAKDDRCPVDGAQKLATRLREAGTPTELKIFADAGHSIPIADREQIVNAFIERWLLRQ